MLKPVSRKIALIIAIFAVNGAVFAADEQVSRKIAEVEDFQAVGRLSEEKRLPLVLMFSSEYCAYCVRLENDFLIPMQISGDYEDRALIRKLHIDYGTMVRDFDGKRIAVREFASRYGISVTPTVVFLDAEGSQLAPKQVGLTTPEFYGGYLDASIDTARDMLRRNRPLRITLDEGLN